MLMLLLPMVIEGVTFKQAKMSMVLLNPTKTKHHKN